jgi:hypothetical protein
MMNHLKKRIGGKVGEEVRPQQHHSGQRGSGSELKNKGNIPRVDKEPGIEVFLLRNPFLTLFTQPKTYL